jgi:hypothetical protein
MAISASAQYPQPSSQAQKDTTANAVTVEGCLMREVDVPGRRPPDAERARVRADNEYVLTDTKMIKGSAPSPAEPLKDEKPTGTSGSASAPLYKVEQIDKDQMAQHRGHRVQVEGVFAHLDRATNRPSPATDLVEIRATAIRAVAGDCPSK